MQEDLFNQICEANPPLSDSGIDYNKELKSDLQINDFVLNHKLILDSEFYDSELDWIQNIEVNALLLLLSVVKNIPDNIKEIEIQCQLIDIQDINGQIEKLICKAKKGRLVMQEINHLKLQHLEISGVDAIDTVHFAQIKSLTNLILNNNSFIQMKGLTQISQLKHLSLRGSNINDIQSLIFLTELTYIDLSNNNIQNVHALKDMTMLQELNLNFNQIDNINELEKLNSILILRINHNNINDVSVVQNISDLTFLDVSYNNLESIESFMHLKKMKELKMGKNHINSLSSLKFMNQLEILSAQFNQIIDLSDLQSCSQLKSINLIKNQIKNINPLFMLTNLEFIDVSYNQIAEINIQIQNLVRLSELKMTSNLIKNIEFLSGCKNLQHLHLKSNQIVKVFSLFPPKLITLNIEHNQVFLITYCNAPHLKSLNLKNNFILEPKIKFYENSNFREWIGIQHNVDKNYIRRNFSNSFQFNKLFKETLTNQKKSNREIILQNNCKNYSINKHQDTANANIPFIQKEYSFIKERSLKVKESFQIEYRLGVNFMNLSNQLVHLTVEQCKISSINCLKELVKLKTLDISQNCIQDISEIRFLKELESLNLQNNSIMTIDVLLPLRKLKFTKLDGNCIPSEQFLRYISTQYSNSQQRQLTPEQKLQYARILRIQKVFGQIEKIGTRKKVLSIQQVKVKAIHLQQDYTQLQFKVAKIAQMYTLFIKQQSNTDYSQ
ncbi:Conserved_hypothetical protein [Hexamita inflata]|uniref:Uncharacterized protein n=1 Tax=Hexamita inflata TaxID=28002 RepID=A0AA86NG76_9EUKA|nr:Conserved hypothetical protein [Hexamita inflata]